MPLHDAIPRRSFLALAAVPLVPSLAQVQQKYRLIAHRGGVVDETHPENSPGSIQAAIDRGYWMLEVDIRRTKDGEPVLQHDPTFARFYGENSAVEEMVWDEVRELRSKPGNTSPIHLRDVCKMCQGKVSLMLDIKSEGWPDKFYESVIRCLDEHDLLHSAYLLGGAKLKRFFYGKCRLSSDRKSLRQALARREDVASNYYLFELASVLDEETVQLCRTHEVTPVAAINTFRYTMANRDEVKGPEEDAARLKSLGVTHYQIDSRYDHLFLGERGDGEGTK